MGEKEMRGDNDERRFDFSSSSFALAHFGRAGQHTGRRCIAGAQVTLISIL